MNDLLRGMTSPEVIFASLTDLWHGFLITSALAAAGWVVLKLSGGGR